MLSPLSFEIQKSQYRTILTEAGMAGMKKLKESRILVIGAGRTGSSVLNNLAEAGIGTIGIADYSRVEANDFKDDNQLPAGYSGLMISHIEADKIKKSNPECLVYCHNVRVSRLNIVDLVSSYDLVVDCSNNNPTHYLINDVTEILDIPMVYGAADNDFGYVAVFNLDGGPSFRCLQDKELPVTNTLLQEGSARNDCLPQITGLLLACEAIKIITGTGETLSSTLLKIDINTCEVRKISFSVPDGYQPSGIRESYGEENDYVLPAITPDELKEELRSGTRLTVFDIRPPEQFIKFNIGGINVSAEFLLNNPEDIPSEGKVVIVCGLGDESMAIVDYLRNNENLTNVLNLEGGIENWLDSII
jgi:sulfur-carrier protein adenylyltransferase/sulfurtransferase